jgi:hypothetical protein
MRQNNIWKWVSRAYDQAEIALWSLGLSAIICFAAFAVPQLPEIWARAERIRAQEIAAEHAYFCEKIGTKADSRKYSQCLLALGKFRLAVEKRIAAEEDF